MTRFPKIIALLAFVTAAGCRDSFPNVVPPLDILYFPVGIAVRQLAPTPADPYGSSQLVVVNSNFDLRYDQIDGGTVLVVDPDRSQDTEVGGALSVLGSFRIASFGGEAGLVEARCQPGWPDCPSGCPPLASDPVLAAGGAKLVVASRSGLQIYRMSITEAGGLDCGAGCPFSVPIDRPDPYGVSIACSEAAGFPAAYAFVSHLMAANNLGWLTRLNLAADDDVLPLLIGSDGTYSSVFNPANDRLFVTSTIGFNQQFRWFNPLVTVSDVNGFAMPEYAAAYFSALLTGAAARDMAVSSDGQMLYVTVDLYDVPVAAQTGSFFTQGGAVAIFDLAPSSFGEPRMALQGIVRTCLGVGQIRRLPHRDGKPDLLAVTCDTEGALAIIDTSSRTVVRYVGLDTSSGLPVLGRSPFGLAVEPIDPARATIPVAGSGYQPSPCTAGRDCQRIYVGSFLNHWVNVLELDPDRPTDVALVKRIGRGP